MQLAWEWIGIACAAGPMPSLSVRPARIPGPLPGVLLIQEAWGVDAHLQNVASRLAMAGYQVLAPDLWSRGGQRPEALAPDRIEAAKRLMDGAPPGALFDAQRRGEILAQRHASEAEQLSATLGALFPLPQLDTLLEPLAAAADHLRRGPCRGRGIAALGFCMGGGLASLYATHDAELAAAVAFYGMPPPPERAASLRCPLLGLYAGTTKDSRITGSVPAFAAAAQRERTRYETVIYEDAAHAFFNDTRPSYHPEAARDAWARALGLLARELR
jgi:carboxymethylenebutenolidase